MNYIFKPPCAGVIIINNKDQVLTVNTKKKHFGFPKGKRKKDETTLENALRELEEETGITIDQIDIVDKVIISEYKKPQSLNPNIQYFLGFLKDQYADLNKFTYDQEELDNVSWIYVNELLEFEDFNFKQARKEVLREVYQLVNQIRIDKKSN